MRKFRLLLINTFIIICIYQILEIVCFGFELHRAYPFCGNGRTFSQFIKDNIKMFDNKAVNYDSYYKRVKFRPVFGQDYNNKKPILIFGCSYAYGWGLEDNQTFSYKLSEYTKRKVYNRAYSGWGPQNMLYQLRRDDFYNTVPEEPEYIIYVYMNGHSYRVFREVWSFENQLFYRYSDDKLEKSVFSSGGVLYGFIARKIRYIIAECITNIPCFKNHTEDIVIKHFIESRDEASKHWKNTKYAVFFYSYNGNETGIVSKLKDRGFDVIRYCELTNENINSLEYMVSKYDMHPNEKAWDLFTPLISEKLNL